MKKNSPAKVLFASLAGTTIEFFDFYIYANAAVLVFPSLFLLHQLSQQKCSNHLPPLLLPSLPGH